MIELNNTTTHPLSLDLLDRIVIHLSPKEIELFLTHDDLMTQINASTRGINRPTDVLSFPAKAFKKAPLGSIIINIDYASRIANHFGHSLDDEIALLFIHGMLHLMGYDHERDSGQMRTKEHHLVRLFQLPLSLIERTQG